MRIGLPINIALGKTGGIETYAINLVRALQGVDRTNEYVLFCSYANEEAFPVTGGNFKKIVTGGGRTVERLRYRAAEAAARVFEMMEERAALRGVKRGAERLAIGAYRRLFPQAGDASGKRCDLLHYMFNILPEDKFGIPVILTVVDIQHEYFPEFFSRDVLEKRRRSYLYSARKADHIIAISAFTKNTIIEKYGVPVERISVTHLGYDSAAFRRLEGPAVERFRERYALPEDFLLYPAATWPHKNHINLVRAYRILKEKYGLKERLVLTGIKKEGHAALEKEIRTLGIEREVLHIGYIPHEELPLLFNAASLLVFPSLFEGFGIPLVEAMAVGLPVACSNTTSLPEVGGDAVEYFDPSNPEDIAEKVFRARNDTELRARLIRRGLERAKEFTWEKTAEETVRVYEKVFKGLKPGYRGASSVTT